MPELDYLTTKGKRVAPDGTVKDALRLSWGYWEAKDTDDDLDEEIQKKFTKGYPQDNILFEDSRTLVLIQAGSEAGRVLLDAAAAHVADLLARVCTVSVQTMEIVDALAGQSPLGPGA